MTGGRALAAVGVLAVVAFAFQRARSPFLRIEAEPELAARIAAEVGLEPLDVMAIRELLGIGLRPTELQERAARFAVDRGAFGGSDALAAIAAAGHREVAERALAAAGGDAVRAEAALRDAPEAIFGVRFRAVRARFAARRPQ